jgi:hypothetical protein
LLVTGFLKERLMGQYLRLGSSQFSICEFVSPSG